MLSQTSYGVAPYLNNGIFYSPDGKNDGERIIFGPVTSEEIMALKNIVDDEYVQEVISARGVTREQLEKEINR
ncbi:hypothetical protein COU56_01885 [Candidatus Pacearchaeota archaeon CG10_big_fil_rev_8_21_14_0_10_31_9]|nr:MAG: hypothetical protein AUJ62_03790 [Candidatus Pacearchaeota archaeon CG1_02_32_21]PIN95350.1 MAG: hypothetical protein COU56_01885 [Candidatus Pacearchaeota archaeon CG10_big_fil_rev_8_21_14_0_10_31_9]PIZ83427.1 MAG: hypothetical protein COX97_01145 [Candidatus Pacearchaeota archaeon CG_4_10_14_0_2_um_filter_05_32_18]